MGEIGTAYVTIGAKIDDLTSALKQVKDQLGGTQKETEKTGGIFKSLWGQMAAGILAAASIQKAFTGIVDVFKGSIKSATDSEQSQLRLKTALDSTGRTTKAMLPGLIAYSNQIAKETLYTDEQAQASMTLLAQLTRLDANGIKLATRGAAGLAAVLGIDLQSATMMVTKAMEGNTQGLRRAGIYMDESLKGDALKAAILEKLNGLYVRAQAETQTYGGRIKNLGKWVDEVKESFGNAIVKNEGFNKLIKQITDDIITLIESGKLDEWADKISSALTTLVKSFDYAGDAMRGAFGGGIIKEMSAAADHLSGINDKAKDLEMQGRKAVVEFAKSLQVLKPTAKELRDEIEKGPESWAKYTASMKETDDKLAKNKDTIVGWMKSGLEQIGVLDKTKAAINETGNNVKSVTQRFEEFKEELKKTSQNEDKIKLLQKAISELSGSIPSREIEGMKDALEKLKKETYGTTPEIKLLDIEVDKLDASAKEVGNSLLENLIPALRLSGKTTKDEFEFASTEVAVFADKIKNAGTLNEQHQREIAKQIKIDWNEVADNMANYWISALAEMKMGTMTAADFLKGAWNTLSVGIGSAVGDMVSKSLSALGGIAGPIGTLFGGVIGMVLSSLSELFSATEHGFQRVQKSLKDLGDISEDLAKKIANVVSGSKASWDSIMGGGKKVFEDWLKKYRGLDAAMKDSIGTSKYLNEVIKETGVNLDNINKYWELAAKALEHYAAGYMTATEASAVLDDAFSQLLAAAQKFGTEGSAAMVEFIIKCRESGLEVASVTAYVQEQLGKIPNSLSVLIESTDWTRESLDELGNKITEVSAGSREKLEGLGAVAVQTFNAMLASGMSFTEAVAAMKEPLAALRDKYKELGIGSDEALERLFKIVGVTEQHGKLFSAIDANKQILEALGNSGWLTADALKTLAGNAGDYYNQLTAAGLSSEDALRAMGPTLQKIYEYAKTYGLQLDENTLKLIAQGKELGIVKEKVDLGEEAQKTNTILEKMLDIFSKIADKLSGVLDNMRQIPTHIRTVVDVEYNNPGLPEIPGRQKGGGGGDEEPIYAQHGFEGTVTGPRMFYVEPGVTEHVSIAGAGKSSAGAGGGAGVTINFAPQINALDSQSVYQFMAGPGRDALVKIIKANVQGVAREISNESKKFG